MSTPGEQSHLTNIIGVIRTTGLLDDLVQWYTIAGTVAGHCHHAGLRIDQVTDAVLVIQVNTDHRIITTDDSGIENKPSEIPPVMHRGRNQDAAPLGTSQG